MPVWLIVLLVIFGLYLSINILAYLLQERLLFKPERLKEDFKFKYDTHEFEEYNIAVEEGVNINGVHFKVPDPRGVVLYLKGNSRSIKGWGKFAIDFTRFGYDVIMVDYRGFGKSTGKRSEDAIMDDLRYVYKMIKEQVDEKYIVVYGRSMGSGFAAYLASLYDPRLLILDAPYYSMKHSVKRYLPFMTMAVFLRYPIETYKFIRHVSCPIKIIHGTKDSLIPYHNSVKLAKLNEDKAELFPILGGRHNNLHTFENYHELLEEFLQYDSQVQEMIDDTLYSQEERSANPNLSSLEFKRKKRRP